jgi:hypothetical protein
MDFEVDRDDLHRTRVVDPPPAKLPTNGARLRVEAFALTSNNITYAAFGDMLQYWSFFPAAPGGEADSWGRVPVWGFAEVVESAHDDVPAGRRVYGYLPMSTELVVEVGRVDARGFSDVAAHRRAMAGAYNRYLLTEADPIHEATRQEQQMVLWPLFFTSFLIDDFLGDEDCFGASTVVVSSASSKTAIGAAYLLGRRPGVTVVGLTSPGNRAFVEQLGCYGKVACYEEASGLEPADAVYVDVAGNRDIMVAVHERFGDRLRHSMVVGGTHWDHRSDAPPPAVGPTPAFFFAPNQIAKRTKEWGQAALDAAIGDAWRAYSAWTDSWLTFEHAHGPEAVERAYRALLGGTVDPRVGYICSMAAS